MKTVAHFVSGGDGDKVYDAALRPSHLPHSMARHSLFEFQNIDGKSIVKTVEVSSEVIHRFAAEHESGVARLIAFLEACADLR